MNTKHDVCAIVLNWNGSAATIECLQALDTHCDVPMVVVGNGSADDSMARLTRYLKGAASDVLVTDEHAVASHDRRHGRVLIANHGNYGYAGGNNVAVEYARRAGYKYIWLLNNDVTIEAGALEALIETIEQDPKCGFTASILVYEDRPDVLQCYGGGQVYPWLGKTKLLGKSLPRDQVEQANLPEPEYLMGACMLVRMEVVEQVGPLEHRYFMYSEEVDWQRRAAAAGNWHCRIAKHSFVRHGDSGSTRGRSHMFHYYRNRAAIMYNRRFHSGLCTWFSALALAAITVLQNRHSGKNIRYGIKGISEGLAFQWR